MENTTRKEAKLYYLISEVAKMYNVNESLLRYWEKEFPIIAPRKTSKGIRYYNKENIENIGLVYYLVKELGMTLPGAKKRLKENKTGVKRNHEIVEKLRELREEIIAIRDLID